jgi:hypothetical protein
LTSAEQAKIAEDAQRAHEFLAEGEPFYHGGDNSCRSLHAPSVLDRQEGISPKGCVRVPSSSATKGVARDPGRLVMP